MNKHLDELWQNQVAIKKHADIGKLPLDVHHHMLAQQLRQNEALEKIVESLNYIGAQIAHVDHTLTLKGK